MAMFTRKSGILVAKPRNFCEETMIFFGDASKSSYLMTKPWDFTGNNSIYRRKLWGLTETETWIQNDMQHGISYTTNPLHALYCVHSENVWSVFKVHSTSWIEIQEKGRRHVPVHVLCGNQLEWEWFSNQAWVCFIKPSHERCLCCWESKSVHDLNKQTGKE